MNPISNEEFAVIWDAVVGRGVSVEEEWVEQADEWEAEEACKID